MSRANENRQKAHNVKKEVVRNVCNHLLAGPEKKWSEVARRPGKMRAK